MVVFVAEMFSQVDARPYSAEYVRSNPTCSRLCLGSPLGLVYEVLLVSNRKFCEHIDLGRRDLGLGGQTNDGRAVAIPR